jgi:hypothetical protein
VGSRIAEKEKMYAELAIKNARESMASMSDPAKVDVNSLMVDGYSAP